MGGQLRIDVAGAVSVCTELLLYGVFFSLFVEVVYVIVKKRMTKSFPSKVFFVGTWLMFLVATTHIVLNIYRLLRGYVYLRDSVGPEAYFSDLGRWDNVAHDAVNAVMTWLGDGLAIYRCFIVWGNNYYIIVLPVLLMIVSIVSNSVALHLFTLVPLGTIFSPTLVNWMNTLYSVALVQNVFTTSLIAFRIYQQERASSALFGMRTLNKSSSLMPIIRIIIESAMGYTAILIVLIVLYARDSNGQFIMQESSVPAVGIVFTLITIRIAMKNSRTLKTTTVANPEGITWAMSVPAGDSTSTGNYTSSADPSRYTETIHLKDKDNLTTQTEEMISMYGTP